MRPLSIVEFYVIIDTFCELLLGFALCTIDFFCNISLVTHCSTNTGIKPGYITERFLRHFLLCRRKQDRAPDLTLLSQKPQAIKWLLAAFVSFDIIPHNSLSNFRELWGMVSNCFTYFFLFNRKTLIFNKKAHFVTSLRHRAYDSTCAFFQCHRCADKDSLSFILPETACAYARPSFLFSMIRGPPLLKFWSKHNKISEES